MYLIPCDHVELPWLLRHQRAAVGSSAAALAPGLELKVLCYTAFAKLCCLPSPRLQAARRNTLITLEKGLVWDQLQIVCCWFWVQGKTGEDYAAEWAAVIREIQDEECLIPGKLGNIWGCRQTIGMRISLSREKRVTITVWKLSAAPNC